MTKRVLVLTGIRSEYYLSRSVYQAIVNHSDLDLEVIVTGSHLTPLHEYSGKTIEEDGFPVIDKIESLLNTDSPSGRLKSGALQLQVLSHVVSTRRPDWLLAIGDREETITLALCGAYLNIPTAHYGAGDRAVGNVDDTVRHAVSRLSHLMLTASEESRNRLICSGEQAWRVQFVGNSGLDRYRTTPNISDTELALGLGVKSMPDQFVIAIYHPLTSEIAEAGQYARIMFEALKELNVPVFVSHPNSDAGQEKIIEVIKEYSQLDFIHSFHNISDPLFVNLMRRATMMVGNSSAGILESPFLKLPVVNIGTRQRERTHAENVFFVTNKKEDIVEQARAILYDEQTKQRVAQCGNPFGDGYASEKVAECLAKTPIDKKLLVKDLTF